MSALFRPYGTTPAVVDIHHRIGCCQLLAVNTCRILFAGDLLTPEGIGRHTGTVSLPPCRGHKEVAFADLTLPWVMTVMQPLEEVCDNKTVVTVKEQSPCHNLSFALGIPVVQTVNTELTEEQKEENRRNVLQDLDDLFG